MINQIAQGLVLGKAYLILMKIIGVIMIPYWIIFFTLTFAFTYNPSEKEIKNYPPILNTKVFQNSLSHFRYNLRVIYGTLAPIDPKLFKDMSPDEISNFPKQKDALLTKKTPFIYYELANIVPYFQKEINDIYVELVQEVKKQIKDKPITKLDWNVFKDKE